MTDDPRTPTGNPTEEGDLSAAPAAPTQPVEVPAASPSSASGPPRAGGALRWAVAILVVIAVPLMVLAPGKQSVERLSAAGA